MSKRSTFLVSLVVVLCSVLNTTADLVGYWPLDGNGVDAGGNGLDGTLSGGPVPIEDRDGNPDAALLFSGEADCYVDLEDREEFRMTGAMTLAAWVWLDGGNTNNGRIVAKQAGGGSRSWSLNIEATSGGVANPGTFQVASDGNTIVGINDQESLPTDDWVHLAGVYEPSVALELYVNGYLKVRDTSDVPPTQFSSNGNSVLIGSRHAASNCGWMGAVDEVYIYSSALTAHEIKKLALRPKAHNPSPRDGAIYEDTWVTLSWRPGDLAVSHDVYLGDNLTDIEEATRDADVFRGNQPSTFYVAGFPGYAYPEGLVPGTTYYWRIDEVNEADPNNPWKGPVWSFSIPPKTAYNPVPADGDGVADTAATLSWTPGFGSKLHTIYFGEDYDQVNNATVGVARGTADYSPGQLEPEKVYYWRVDEFDGLATYKGEVWTFTTPGAVGNPQPANGATDVTMATILSWTSADNAASHQVYLGLDKETVRNADTGSPEYKGPKTLGAERYDPGLLERDTAYYWRVDEVYAGNPVKGPVWSFTVGDYLVVDDFEGYTDDDPNNEAIWQHWIDGFGVADNGAQVGYLMPPYAEQTIVHGGLQSMPLLYVNETGVTNSEAALTLTTPRDWTAAGVGALSLWLRGSSANAAEPLYVSVSNSAGAPAVVAHSDSGVATSGGWKQWVIALPAFADQGINLANVDKIAIGLGSKSGLATSGGSGTMYIDDIRLYLPSGIPGR
jgi:hypothetical protein